MRDAVSINDNAGDLQCFSGDVADDPLRAQVNDHEVIIRPSG